MKPTVMLLKSNVPFVFSIPPIDLRIDSSQNITNIKLIDFGEIAKTGERNLDRISFSSFFPDVKSAFYKPFLNPLFPTQCVEQIRVWKETKSILKLIVPEFNISYSCRIESFNHTYDERTGDINFELSLIEERDPRKLDVRLGIYERWF